jgi:hypothetical protein
LEGGVGGDPVDGPQELHAEGRLKALDELGDPLHALKGGQLVGEEGARFLGRAREQLQGGVWAVVAVSEAARVVALHVAQRLAEVVGVGAVVVGSVV